MPKLKIDLFGESSKIKYLKFTPGLLTKISNALKDLDQEVVLSINDPTFYKLLAEPGIESVNDLKFIKVGGLRNTYKNQVEIWFNGKKIMKIKLDSLFRPNTLFSLYDTKTSTNDFGAGLYIVEEAIGLIANYEIQVEHFEIQQLQFELFTTNHQGAIVELLTHIAYAGTALRCRKEDSLISNFYAEVIQS